MHALGVRRTGSILARAPYRTWGYPWTPIVFILSAAASVLNTVTVRPVESPWGVLLVALGLPAYGGGGADRRHEQSGAVV